MPIKQVIRIGVIVTGLTPNFDSTFAIRTSLNTKYEFQTAIEHQHQSQNSEKLQVLLVGAIAHRVTHGHEHNDPGDDNGTTDD